MTTCLVILEYLLPAPVILSVSAGVEVYGHGVSETPPQHLILSVHVLLQSEHCLMIRISVMINSGGDSPASG